MSKIYEALKKAEEIRAAQGISSQPAYTKASADPMSIFDPTTYVPLVATGFSALASTTPSM
jgi:hypothetical protein